MRQSRGQADYNNFSAVGSCIIRSSKSRKSTSYKVNYLNLIIYRTSLELEIKRVHVARR